MTVSGLYMQAPVSNTTIVAIAVIFFLLLQKRLDTALLGSWTSLMIAVAGLRLVLWSMYRRGKERYSLRQWLYVYTVASTLVGCVWGLIHLIPEGFGDLIVDTALLMLLFGVLSSALSILFYYLPAFLGYSVPQLAFFAYAMHTQGDRELALLSVTLLVYLVMLTLFARNAHRQFVHASRLGMDNEALVDELHHENTQREKIIEQRTAKIAQTNELLREQVQERQQAEEALMAQKRSLQHMAQHDALTGLPNRILLTDRLRQATIRARRTDTICALLFIDLDHFKQINDSLGHSTGDQLLKKVADRLLGVVREEDTVARLGGDEFVLLIEGLADSSAVKVLAEKVLASFRSDYIVGKERFNTSASIGISLYPRDGHNPETLLRNADSAMYRAKAEGRGTFRFYSAEMTEVARSRLTIEADLRQALRGDELELYLQPQVSLPAGEILGAEALLRWRHPKWGMQLPDSFIPIAEESALINEVGRWVLNEGCRQLRRWQDEGLDGLTLAVNLSGREFWNNPLIETLEGMFSLHGCPASSLELEITESYLVQRPEQSRKLIKALRERGVSVAVDDFGTGYSSLAYLKQYPITRLKIDGSFVRDISIDADDQAIVRAIIALAHSLELQVIGEGVETETQADFLCREHCDQAQGFLYAKPMPADDFVRLALSGRTSLERSSRA